MIPVTITPPPKISLTFKRNNTFALNLEPRPGINLAGSKTITVLNVEGAGSAVSLTLITGGGAVNGGRVVMIANGKVVYWQPNNSLPIGISLTSASSDSEITVITSGKITIPGWGLVPGTTYYATADGVLATNPATGWYQLVGTAITSETLILNIQQPINTI